MAPRGQTGGRLSEVLVGNAGAPWGCPMA